jgi:hypothetical protein
MVAQLRKAGIDVEVDPEEYPNGMFARLQDPEGNPIQLWELEVVNPYCPRFRVDELRPDGRPSPNESQVPMCCVTRC